MYRGWTPQEESALAWSWVRVQRQQGMQTDFWEQVKSLFDLDAPSPRYRSAGELEFKFIVMMLDVHMFQLVVRRVEVLNPQASQGQIERIAVDDYAVIFGRVPNLSVWTQFKDFLE